MNPVVALLDNEDIAYLTEQENILKALQAPFLAVVHGVNNIDFTSFEPEGDYEHKYHFLYQAKQKRQHLFEESLKAVEEIAREFVSMIQWHLENKYDIDLHLSLGESFDFPSLSLETVYSLLEKEMNGMTFQEKSIETVKKGVRELYPTATGKTVEIKHGFDMDILGHSLAYHSKEKLKALFKGIALFETGKKELSRRMNFILEYGWKEGELELEKALKFKTFKNGKCTVTFKEKEDAENFVQFFASKKIQLV